MKIGIFFSILILGLLVFFPIFINGFVGDDRVQSVDNVLTHSMSNIPRFFFGGTTYDPLNNQLAGTYYKPIMSSFFTIIISIFGSKAFFLHFFQVLLYIVNAYLLYLVLRRIFVQEGLAIILSVIFLVHPVNSEVAAFISDTQDVLFFFFGMLAICLVLYTKNLTGVILSNVFLCLSLLSKETGILFFLPVFLLRLLTTTHIKGIVNVNERDYRNNFGLHYLLMLIILVLYFIIRVSVPLADPTFLDIQIMNAPFKTVLVTLPSSLFFYIKNVVSPLDLAVLHSTVVNTITFSDFYLPLFADVLFIAAIIWLGKLCWRRKEQGLFTTFLFFLAWFATGMLLHLNIFFRLDGTVAARWFYFPFVGLLGLIGTVLKLLPPLKKKNHVTLLFALLLIIIGLLAIRTSMRTLAWKDDLTLLAQDSKGIDDPAIETNYGQALWRAGKKKDAEYHSQKAVSMYPGGNKNWENLGYIYVEEGKVTEAKDAYINSMRNGNSPMAAENYARLMLENDPPKKTYEFVTKALEVLPNDSVLQSLLTDLQGLKNVNVTGKFQYLPKQK